MAISMLKIRRPLGRLIFNMGIAIPGKTVFLIETAPCSVSDGQAVTLTFSILFIQSYTQRQYDNDNESNFYCHELH